MAVAHCSDNNHSLSNSDSGQSTVSLQQSDYNADEEVCATEATATMQKLLAFDSPWRERIGLAECAVCATIELFAQDPVVISPRSPIQLTVRPTFKLPYLESDSNRPTMTFKLTYYDIQTVLLGRSHLRQTRVCLRW